MLVYTFSVKCYFLVKDEYLVLNINCKLLKFTKLLQVMRNIVLSVYEYL